MLPAHPGTGPIGARNVPFSVESRPAPRGVFLSLFIAKDERQSASNAHSRTLHRTELTRDGPVAAVVARDTTTRRFAESPHVRILPSSLPLAMVGTAITAGQMDSSLAP